MPLSSPKKSVSVELLKKYDRPGPRYTSYPTAPNWTEDVGPKDYEDSLRAASANETDPLSLYLHIPFCRRRCYYCGCNTCVVKERDAVTTYLKALHTEIDRVSDLLAPRRRVGQLHLGGGTPTYLTIDELSSLFDRIGDRFEFTPNCEKSMEVDPRVTTDEQLTFLHERGFNRISFGVQDLDPEVQKAIGRIQPTDLVTAKLEHVRRLGFEGVNFDLIYGLPRQRIDKFAHTIDEVVRLRPDRIALYSFAFLPQRMAHQMKLPKEDLPDLNTKFGLFAMALERLTAAGYRQIGMDHFALPEDELTKAQKDGRLHRNFMGYTVQSTPDMVGLGMSSIGYIDDSFFQNISSVGDYSKTIAGGSLATYRGLRLKPDDLIRNYVIESLMCNFEVSFKAVSERFDIEYQSYFAEEHSRLSEFVDDELLFCHDNGMAVTPPGRTFVRNIAMTFDTYLPKDPKRSGPNFSRTI